MRYKAVIIIALCLCALSNSACSTTRPVQPGPPPAQGEAADGASFPLIVVGGGPEGVAAAVSAARNGVKTLLIEEDPVLGGLMTQGRLNFLDMNYGPQKELLTRGIFQEFYEDLGNAFDIDEAKQYFLQLVQKEPNITLLLRTKFLAPIMQETALAGVEVNENGAAGKYYGQRIIDATTDADVAFASGAPCTVGAEDYGQKDRIMGVTLVFSVKGVNWPYVFLYNNYNRLISKIKPGWGDPAAGATWKVAWGYGPQALEYKPHDPNMRFRGPNLARQKDGSVLLNALLIFGVDGLDSASKAAGLERGKKEIPYILEFMRSRFPGFKKVELVDTAPQLYVRETRHIQGEYRLTIDDVLENRDQWDRIALGSYPVDIQPAGPEDLGNVIGKPALYSVPFRSIVPQKVDQLLVVGRSASYDSLAAGSARVLPVGMAVGEAAGVAAAFSLDKDIGFREICGLRDAVHAIQETLGQQGAYLPAFDPPRPDVMDHWAYPGLKVMRKLGLAAGGYTNDYRLDQGVQPWDAVNYLNYIIKAIRQANPQSGLQIVQAREISTNSQLVICLAEALTVKNASADGVSADDIHAKEINMPEAQALLRQKGILTREIESRLTKMEERPAYGVLYSLLARFYEEAV